MLNDYGGRAYRERRAGGETTLRNRRMPIIAAAVWLLIWPLMATLVIGGAAAALAGVLPAIEVVMVGALAVAYALCLAGAVRALRARVVVTDSGVRVHNTLRTRRVPWAEIEDFAEVSFLNTQALDRAQWFGVAVRARGRRRPIGVMASWSHEEEYAKAFAHRLRSLAPQNRR